MEQKKLFFQKLTPVNDADVSVYEEALNFIFENADITNVAISGAYSAGKSSVIESYKQKHKNLKFIHISLAHFDSPNKKDDPVKESVLEGKILNQLIHQIPVERIPQTNFRVKKDTGEKDVFLMTLLLCLLFGSILFLTLANKISAFVNGLSDNVFKDILSGLTGNYAILVVAFVFIISSVICIYNVVKIQKNKNLFHKVSVSDEKMHVLLNDRIVEMNAEGLKYVRENYKSHVVFFIERNLDLYLKLLSSEMFVYDEAIQLLELEFEDEKKIEILQYTSKPISVCNKSYSDKLIAYILGNNLDNRDAEYLYQHYSQYHGLIRDEIYKVAEAHVEDIIMGNGVDLDDMLLSDVLIKSSLDINVKIQLWAKMIPKLNEETCKKHFDELGFSELKGIFTKKNTTTRTYAKSDEVTAIFEALKKNTWIYDYRESENDSDRYFVIKNGPKSGR